MYVHCLLIDQKKHKNKYKKSRQFKVSAFLCLFLHDRPNFSDFNEIDRNLVKDYEEFNKILENVVEF